METTDPTFQEVSGIVQAAQPVREEQQSLEIQRKESMRRVMAELKSYREKIGNFCTVIEADPSIPTSQEALLLPIPVQIEDRNGGVDRFGQGKLTDSNVVVSENGYWIARGTQFSRYFGQETLRLENHPEGLSNTVVYRTLSDAESFVNPNSQERLVGHVLLRSGTKYGLNLRPTTTEVVVRALKQNISSAQNLHRPDLERAQEDIVTTQAVTQTLTGGS